MIFEWAHCDRHTNDHRNGGWDGIDALSSLVQNEGQKVYLDKQEKIPRNYSKLRYI